MITIRSSTDVSEPALISLEATLRTPDGIYAMASDGPLAASSPTRNQRSLGGIAWPHSRFRLAPGVILEQQIFLPNDDSAVALSWQLRGHTAMLADLTITPFFAGCAPQSYRDIGFRLQSPENGGRLTWLPRVLGPRIIADTNGAYREDIVFRENLVAPGTFEFRLGASPSILIFSHETTAGHPGVHQMGAFLAGLIPQAELSGSLNSNRQLEAA
jgi:hypothetical protein